MKKVVITVLIVIAILLITAAVFISFSVYQGYKVVQSVQNPQLRENVMAFSEGDCTKLPEIKSQVKEIQTETKSACGNPLIKFTIYKIQKEEICTKIIYINLDELLKPIEDKCAILSLLPPEEAKKHLGEMNASEIFSQIDAEEIGQYFQN